MRYYIGYHNEHKMNLPCTSLPYPRVRTSKSVAGLEGATVWLIAGVGAKSPKSYFVASRFTIETCESDKYLGEKLPNEVAGFGAGKLLGLSVPLNGTPLLDDLKRISANFISGFCEVHEPAIVSALKART